LFDFLVYAARAEAQANDTSTFYVHIDLIPTYGNELHSVFGLALSNNDATEDGNAPITAD
jgi:hypothetical protein